MTNTKYDLEDRTRKFGSDVIVFAKQIPESLVTRSLISQLVRSATSVGSNYCEADDAESRKDFKHKIGICKKESRESKHWLKMIAIADPLQEDKVKQLYQEAKELNLIFNAIIHSTNRNIRH
ncbi:four helix bundle protein [Patescibacteria group bacterium]|nr:four helix bundle protein [Patescibacteria group bacterium]MBU0963873.1 four helix bundle protein [Patescibacteria group bacterium]